MASSPLIVVDPDGDLILDVGEIVLSKQRQDAVPPTADWEISVIPSEEQTLNQQEGFITPNTEDPIHLDEPYDTELSLKTHYRKESDVVLSPMDKSRRILVCGKVMTWASSTFRSQLNGPWKDGRQHADRDDEGRMNIKYPDDDPVAMVFLCNMLHHRPGPSLTLDYNSLARLAVLTDKYDCYATLQVWFRSQWQTRLQIGRKDFLGGFPENTSGYALQTMRMAYRLHDPTWFALAATLYAYTQPTSCIASALRDTQIKDDIELPEALIGKRHFN
ncbi:hypothetical protein H2200_004477 [Cladophialophora chaetospira]|uniref:BTB domain-containing protein n=1 Tax=Cladophialophora chaetospira TaxID=386627 RepID=A0AA38XD66_9EURO|nr:hypothetical protein H2200_004477 [Cladophialophora chaetospira]